MSIFTPMRRVLYAPSGQDITVELATQELALTQHAPTISVDCTVTPATLELVLTQEAPTVVLPGADWIGINSSHLDSFCGEGNLKLSDALDGTNYWYHGVEETHWFILDFGLTYNVQMVRGRSSLGYDPTSVNIYVSDDKENWGAAVATGIDTWQNVIEWQEVDVTNKNGRYLKVEITDTETEELYITFGDSPPYKIFDVYGEVAPTTVEPATFELALTKHAPTLLFPVQTILPSTFALEATLFAPQIYTGALITPDTYYLGLTQHAPSVVIDCNVTPDTFELTLTQHAPTILFDITVYPATLELALTQHAPNILIDCIVTPDTFELELTQETPEVLIVCIILPDTFELALTQHAPSVSIDCTATSPTLELALTQYASEIHVGIIVYPDTLELALSLQDPTILAGVIIIPPTFELALTQHAPKISVTYIEIPPFMQKDLIEPNSGGAWLWLCEIAVPGFDTQRIARNTIDIKYAGENYIKWNLDIGKQTFVGDGSIPRISLRVAQDPDRTFETIMNASKGCHDGTVRLIRTNEKYLEYKVQELEVVYNILTADSDWEWVYFTLGIPNLLQQKIPLTISSSKVCPWAVPDLFKGPRCQYTGEDTSCTGTFEDCYDKGNAVHWGGELGLDPNATRI